VRLIYLLFYVVLSCRGQLLPTGSLTNSCDVEFIHEGIKYELVVTRSNPDAYHVILNNSAVDVETHRLSDGGILLSYLGKF